MMRSMTNKIIVFTGLTSAAEISTAKEISRHARAQYLQMSDSFESRKGSGDIVSQDVVDEHNAMRQNYQKLICNIAKKDNLVIEGMYDNAIMNFISSRHKSENIFTISFDTHFDLRVEQFSKYAGLKKRQSLSEVLRRDKIRVRLGVINIMNAAHLKIESEDEDSAINACKIYLDTLPSPLVIKRAALFEDEVEIRALRRKQAQERIDALP